MHITSACQISCSHHYEVLTVVTERQRVHTEESVHGTYITNNHNPLTVLLSTCTVSALHNRTKCIKFQQLFSPHHWS